MQVLGKQEHQENLIIPTPEYKEDEFYSQLYKYDYIIPIPEYKEYEDLNLVLLIIGREKLKLRKRNQASLIIYFSRGSWRKPSQYVHAQPFFHEDYPVYDLDEEDSR